MRALSLDNSRVNSAVLADGRPKADWPFGLKLGMLALNALPLVHAAAVGWLALAWDASASARCSAAAALLFLAPPLAARLLYALFGKPAGRFPIESRQFLVWWSSLQLQIVFCRLPFLEEAMRLVPGLYSLWLRLWGSRIGGRTYWSAGTLVLDRGYLDIGEEVVFGAGVRLNGHVIDKGPDGRLELAVAPIRIGDRAAIGGYCLLTAGTTVAPGENLRACLASPPFVSWKDGKRERGAVG